MDYQSKLRENEKFTNFRDEPLDRSDDIISRSSEVHEVKRSTRKTSRDEPSTTSEQFTDPPQALQIRLPRDLCKSLKLMSIQEGRSISSIVFDCLTTHQMASKCWIQRKGGSDAA